VWCLGGDGGLLATRKHADPPGVRKPPDLDESLAKKKEREEKNKHRTLGRIATRYEEEQRQALDRMENTCATARNSTGRCKGLFRV
jgi:hypothetical protein